MGIELTAGAFLGGLRPALNGLQKIAADFLERFRLGETAWKRGHLRPVAAFVGLMAGQVAAFAVARAVSRAVARGSQEDLIRAPAPVALFLSRPVPVLAEAVVIAAGAARLGWVPFLLACTSGNALYAAALALNGSQLLPGGLIGPGLLLPMLLPALAWLIWQWRRRNPDRGA